MVEVAEKLVLVVDDDFGMRKSVAGLLDRSGFNTVLYESAEAFLLKFEPLQARNACLVLDVHLEGMSGIELARQMARAGHRVPVIFVTGNDSAAARRDALQEGCIAFLTKPFSPNVLLEAIEQALKQRGDDITSSKRRS